MQPRTFPSSLTHAVTRDLSAPARKPAGSDDDILLTSAQVRERIGGVTTMTLWRWMHSDDVQFPRQIKLGRRNFWRLGDLREWQAVRCGKAA